VDEGLRASGGLGRTGCRTVLKRAGSRPSGRRLDSAVVRKHVPDTREGPATGSRDPATGRDDLFKAHKAGLLARDGWSEARSHWSGARGH